MTNDHLLPHSVQNLGSDTLNVCPAIVLAGPGSDTLSGWPVIATIIQTDCGNGAAVIGALALRGFGGLRRQAIK
jgi:hypothetical protein